MNIYKLKLENFRSYKNEVEITFGNLTTFVGKNDIGKSTILEALDIFFNDKDKQAVVKMDKEDINVLSKSDEIIISVTFKNLPESLILDKSVKTSLRDEYLVTEDEYLEVKKVYKNGKLSNTIIVSDFPDDEVCSGLHEKTITQLKAIAKENDLEVEDQRIASSYRKKILNLALSNGANLVSKEHIIKGTDSKEIWKEIQSYFPLYMLFQSDRNNQDQDSIIQDPMKLLLAETILNDQIAKKLNEVFDEIKDKSQTLALNTLEKLEDMNSELAKELSTEYSEPNWSKAFQFNLKSDNEIPVNKRGSGVRRLILLSFFRAEAERRKDERNVANVIYAFEEPETSQHPDHQKLLIDAFLEITSTEYNQVILTTHSPSIAKLLPTQSLRLLKKDDEFNVTINNPSYNILSEISNELGVYSTIDRQEIINATLVICVEGTNDIDFLKTLNTNQEFSSILNINDENIVILPMGGSSLQYWVNENYLNKLNVKQLHIYDSDIGSTRGNRYKEFVDTINKRNDCYAFQTNLRELENYIPSQTIKEYYLDGKDFEFEKWNNLSIDKWGEIDVPELLAEILHLSSESSNQWDQVTDKKKNNKKGNAKRQLNNTLLTYTLEKGFMLKKDKDEIKSWLKKGAELLGNKR